MMGGVKRFPRGGCIATIESLGVPVSTPCESTPSSQGGPTSRENLNGEDLQVHSNEMNIDDLMEEIE